MIMLSPDTILQPTPKVVFTEIRSQEGALLHLGTHRYFRLNATGVQIWRLLSAGQALGEIGQELVSAYDITPESALQSVFTLGEQLLAENLVQVITAKE